MIRARVILRVRHRQSILGGSHDGLDMVLQSWVLSPGFSCNTQWPLSTGLGCIPQGYCLVKKLFIDKAGTESLRLRDGYTGFKMYVKVPVELGTESREAAECPLGLGRSRRETTRQSSISVPSSTKIKVCSDHVDVKVPGVCTVVHHLLYGSTYLSVVLQKLLLRKVSSDVIQVSLEETELVRHYGIGVGRPQFQKSKPSCFFRRNALNQVVNEIIP